LAVRNESVRLTLDDAGFTTGMARAAAAAALLDKNLNDLDGSNVGANRNLAETARSVDSMGTSFRSSGADIDKFSGRLRLIADAALILGPALVPIGAVAVPAVTGLASAFGFAAVGATTASVAFQGVGDALEAMQKARLEPTVANLQAAREAMQQISAPAREFVNELVNMGPAFRAVRDAAAEGLFPGLTASLDDVERVLPRVASLFNAVGTALGDLSADAAQSLAGPEWAEFFDFLEAEAPAALSQLGHAVGSVAHGFAELWMAFGPLNRDFTGWLRDAARGFDEWASGLSQTDGFQEFIDYIRENGPRVAAAGKAIGNAILQITEALAPIGPHVLDAITGLANALAALADSSFGTPLFTIAAGMAAANRAASLLGAASLNVSNFGASLKNLAKGAGALIALDLAGRAINELRDVSVGAAPDVDQLANSIRGLGDKSLTDVLGGDSLKDALGAVRDSEGGFKGLANEIDRIAMSGPGFTDAIATGFLNLTGMQGAVGATAMETERLANAMASMDAAFVGIASEGGIQQAWTQFQRLAEAERLTLAEQRTLINSMPEFKTQLDAAGLGMGGFADQMARIFPWMAQLSGNTRETGSAFNAAAAAARNFSDALAEFSGWLGKQEALNSYKNALRGLGDALKDGFQPKDMDAILGFGRAVEQVASQIKDKGLRADFLKGAVQSLEGFAAKGPQAAKAINPLLNQLRKLEDANPKPKIDLDPQKFESKAKRTRAQIAGIDAEVARPKADLEDAPFKGKEKAVRGDLMSLGRMKEEPTVSLADRASGPLSGIRGQLNSLPSSKTITITTVHRDINTGTIGHLATGGPVNGPGTATSDSIPAWLSNGEYVIKAAAVEKYGVATFDRLNAMMLAGGGLASHTHARGFANGGTYMEDRPQSYYFPDPDTASWAELMRAMTQATASGYKVWQSAIRKEADERLKEAERRKEALTEELDAAKQFRDSLKQAADSLRDNVAGKFSGSDLFGEDATVESIMSGLKEQAAAASQFSSLTLQLKRLGLEGPALEALLQTGNLDLLKQFAGSGKDALALFESQFNRTQSAAQNAGQTAAFARYGEELAAANRELQGVRKEAQDATRELKIANRQRERLEALAEKNPTETGKAVGREIGRPVARAARRNHA
jgi:hypothetical protein